MKKKFLAFGLAAAMVLGSAFSAFAAETVIGNGWWNANNEKSTPISIADGETVTLNVDVATVTETETKEDGTPDTYAAFCVEVTDGKHFFTTTSAGDAWGDGEPEKDLDVANAAKDGSYTVTVTRSGNDFVAKYVDNATGQAMFGDLKLTGNVDFGDTTVYVMAQIGTLSVEQVEEEPSEDESTSKPSPDGDAETSKPSPDGDAETSKPDEQDTSKDDNKPGEDETTAPSPNGGNEEAVKATVVTAEVAKAVAEAAKITTADGKVLDVVLTATPVEDTTAVAGLIAADKALEAAKVKAFAVLDLELKVGDKKVTYLDNKVNVTIPMDKIFTDIKADETVAVYRVDKDMTFSFLGTDKVAADKTITFATDHFTQYVFAVVDNAEALKDVQIADSKVIYAEDTPDVKVADIPVKENASVDDPDQNKTGDTTPVMPLVVLAVVALGGVVAVVASKKRA